MSHVFDDYGPLKPEMPERRNGVLVSAEEGEAVAYALFNLEPRGRMFVSPGDPVYEGMVIGIHSRDNDLVVNPIKTKKLTNIRAAGKDENVVLTPPIKLTLESAIEFIADDELVEITPKSIRIRKRYPHGARAQARRPRYCRGLSACSALRSAEPPRGQVAFAEALSAFAMRFSARRSLRLCVSASLRLGVGSRAYTFRMDFSYLAAFTAVLAGVALIAVLWVGYPGRRAAAPQHGPARGGRGSAGEEAPGHAQGPQRRSQQSRRPRRAQSQTENSERLRNTVSQDLKQTRDAMLVLQLSQTEELSGDPREPWPSGWARWRPSCRRQARRAARSSC